MPAPRCSSVNLPSSQGPSVLRPCPMCDDEPRLLRQFPLSPGHANTTCPLPLLFGAPLSLRPPPLAFPSRFLTSKPVAPQERVPANLHLANVCNHTEQRGRATLSKQSQVWDTWLLQTARSRAVGATCQQAEAIVGWDPRHITVTKYCAFENTGSAEGQLASALLRRATSSQAPPPLISNPRAWWQHAPERRRQLRQQRCP